MGNCGSDLKRNTKTKTTTTTIIVLQFNRFKKKTFNLLYLLYPEDLEFIEQIKNKKLSQCLIRGALRKRIDEMTFSIPNKISCLMQLNHSQIVSTCDISINMWDLYSGNCLMIIYTKSIINVLAKFNNLF